jgi:hypothetical protein
MYLYWLNVRPQAKRVYPKAKLILHMHIGLRIGMFLNILILRLEYIFRIWLKVRTLVQEYTLGFAV